MAMTKAEKARMEELELELSLRWPTFQEPQPMTREEILAARVEVTPQDGTIWNTRYAALGWWFNVHSSRVIMAWSDGMSHGTGNHTGDSPSQGPGQIYRTHADAVRALHWAACRDAARKLRNIELMAALTPPESSS